MVKFYILEQAQIKIIVREKNLILIISMIGYNSSNDLVG